MPITNFNDLDLTKQYTWADYFSWKFQERVELLRGFVAKMSPAPASRHQIISSCINLELATFLRKKPCSVYYAPFDVYLPIKDKNTVVQPDLFVVCDKNKIKDKGCVGTPDLVVEILSPGNSKREMNDKYDLYEEAGVLEYWVVYPSEQVLQVYLLENGKFVGKKALTNGDTLKTNLLNGFKMEIDAIFESIEVEED